MVLAMAMAMVLKWYGSYGTQRGMRDGRVIGGVAG